MNDENSDGLDFDSPDTTDGILWMRIAGFGAIGCAGLCVVATGIGMLWSYRNISNATVAPKPSDLANGISNALIPSLAVIPLVVVGAALLFLGRSRS